METAENVTSFELLRVGQQIDQIFLHTMCLDWKVDYRSAEVEILFVDGTNVYVVADDRLPAIRCHASCPLFLDASRRGGSDNWRSEIEFNLSQRMEIPYESLRDELKGAVIEAITIYSSTRSAELVRRIVLATKAVMIEIGYDKGINTRVIFTPTPP